jgi:hypothetical protein
MYYNCSIAFIYIYIVIEIRKEKKRAFLSLLPFHFFTFSLADNNHEPIPANDVVCILTQLYIKQRPLLEKVIQIQDLRAFSVEIIHSADVSFDFRSCIINYMIINSLHLLSFLLFLFVFGCSLSEKTILIYTRCEMKLNCYIAIEFFSLYESMKNCTAIYQYSFQMLIVSVLSNGLVRTNKKFQTMR